MTEAHDPGDNLFCEHRLEAVLCTHAGRGSRELVGGVTEALKSFVGTAPPSDDITMLALRWLDAAALVSTFAVNGKFYQSGVRRQRIE